MTKIVLATGNAGKVRELAALLAPLNLDVSAQSDFDVPEAEETGTTFVENAIIKARNAARETGLPAIADDSGLVVDALGGAPGIYSSRFAGIDASDADNIDKLLSDLADVPQEARSARFICCLIYLRHADDPTPIICLGSWEGHIAGERSGADGFGYDPVFFAPETHCTAAELSKEQKNQLSHRGKALTRLLAELQA